MFDCTACCAVCCVATQYGYGNFAPGYKGGDASKYACGHNLLLSHGRTKALYDEKYRAKQVTAAAACVHACMFGCAACLAQPVLDTAAAAAAEASDWNMRQAVGVTTLAVA